MTPTESIAYFTEQCPLAVLEYFLERAAIREADGEPRAQAEHGALLDAARYFEKPRPTLASLSRAASAGNAQDDSGGDGAAEDGNARTGHVANAGSTL